MKKLHCGQSFLFFYVIVDSYHNNFISFFFFVQFFFFESHYIFSLFASVGRKEKLTVRNKLADCKQWRAITEF